MLPPALVSVYREYKKDTNSIASWLASTAKECGYPADLLSGPSVARQQTPGNSQLEGKARAEAKKKAKAPQKPTPQKERPRYVIEIKDFIPLAECISTYKKPALSVPQAFFTTLNRVITVRDGFGSQLAQSNQKTDTQSDAKHSYFVEILKKVREVLKPFSDPAASAPSDEVEALTNDFTALEVYHPSKTFLNAPDIERPRPAKTDEAIYEANPWHSFDEALVAYYMLCAELSDIRTLISGLWAIHLDPDDIMGDSLSLDPAVLAVVTNTSIEFSSSSAEDMKPIFEKHGGMGAMAEHVMSTFLLSEKVDMNNFQQQVLEGTIDEKAYAVMSHCCYLTGLTIETLAKIPRTGVTGIYPDGTFGVLDPHTKWESKSMSQRLAEERVIIGELWTEALALVYHVPDYPFTDEFIRGVKEFKETKKVPFRAILAAEMILDIYKSVGSYAESSVDTLLKRITTMNDALKHHIKSHKDIKSPHWSSRDTKWLQDTQEGFDWFLDDPLYRAKKMAVDNSRNRQEGLAHLERVEKYRILKRSPILAGLALYYHRAEMHEVGLRVTNAWGSIILPAHLANAIGEEGGTETCWVDMDTLYHIFRDEQFFVGGKPKTRSDFVMRFMLQVGVSASTFSKNRRHGKKVGLEDFSRGGARFLTTRASVHKSLQDRYQRNAQRMNWTMETISEVLSKAKSQGKGKGKGKGKPLPADDKILLTPVEVLLSLGQAMQGEAVQAGCLPFLQQINGPTFTVEEWELPFMVGHILVAVEEGHDGILAMAATILQALDRGLILSRATRVKYELSERDYDVPKNAMALLESLQHDQTSP